MTVDLKRFLELFLEESMENLDIVEAGLLALGGGPGDGETINGIFRGIHSIKGGSGTFGLKEVTALGHQMETVLDEIRAGERSMTEEARGLLLAGTDRLRTLLDAASDGDKEMAAGPIVDQIARLATSAGHGSSATPAAAPPPVAAPAAAAGFRVRFVPHPHFYQRGNDPLLILRELASLGPTEVKCDVSRLPPLSTCDPELSYLSWEIELRAEVPEARVRDAFAWVDGDCDLAIEPLTAAGPAPDAGPREQPAIEPTVAAADAVAGTEGPRAAGATAPAAGVDRGSIRVSIDKIDSLVNLVGELVITQSILGQLAKSGEVAFQERLRKGLEQLERNTRELQESVMRVRMLPLRFAFDRLHRLVHDTALRLGKQVDLRIEGGDTELDKTVLERLTDPLIHLVRNALDHGLESPERRVAAGKSPRGTLTVSACHKNGNVVIEIGDDGGGLDLGKIERRARERDLIPEGPITPEQAQALIFLPGFSTAEQVSDLSGRGVGMDVVARNVTEAGGHVSVSSRAGQGTTFTIRLPLTMAILDAQLVRVADRVFIIPLISIHETLQTDPQLVRRIGRDIEVYSVRQQQVPIIHLDLLLGTGSQAGIDIFSQKLIVLVEAEGQHVGLLVDELLDQQQVVLKSLEANFRRVPGVAGATILGDGTVALILDIGGLIKLWRAETNPPRSGSHPPMEEAA